MKKVSRNIKLQKNLCYSYGASQIYRPSYTEDEAMGISGFVVIALGAVLIFLIATKTVPVVRRIGFVKFMTAFGALFTNSFSALKNLFSAPQEEPSFHSTPHNTEGMIDKQWEKVDAVSAPELQITNPDVETSTLAQVHYDRD